MALIVKYLSILLVLHLCFVSALAQIAPKASLPVMTDSAILVATEKAFAQLAAEKGTKTGFLTYLADDGIIFSPTEVNGKLHWKGRAESPALLAWNPAWADVSFNGKLGYTTGGWEYRPKGKTDKPAAFGEYLTIWRKQPDGSYLAVLDIGISHPTNSYSATAVCKMPVDAGKGRAAGSGVDNGIFTDIFSNTSMANGYFNYLADDAVILREGNLPLSGKKSAFIGLERIEGEFPDTSFLKFSANTSKVYGNMMYSWGVYSLTHKDKTVSRWNFVQVWKHRAGKWQIVVDLFNKIEK
jgi:ketosteroid isomerase-like protein